MPGGRLRGRVCQMSDLVGGTVGTGKLWHRGSQRYQPARPRLGNGSWPPRAQRFAGHAHARGRVPSSELNERLVGVPVMKRNEHTRDEVAGAVEAVCAVDDHKSAVLGAVLGLGVQ